MSRLVHFLVALGLWLLVTWSVDGQNLGAGAVVAVLTTLALGRAMPAQRRGAWSAASLVRRGLWLAYYVPMFLIYCVQANLDVAYRVLHINLPIRPGIVKVRTVLQSDIAKTMLANSITLTPGTLTVDIDGQDLYIHWIYVASDDPEEQRRMIVSRFEKVLVRIFEP